MHAGKFASVAILLVSLASIHVKAQITAGRSTAFGSPFHGVPPSVTSFNFGGQPGFHGVPTSVTSLGLGNSGFFPHTHFRAGHGFGFHHHHDFGFGSPFFGDIVAVPYGYPIYDVGDPGVDDSLEQEDYRGGPTIFDQRGGGEEYYRPQARDERREEDFRRSPEPQPANEPPRAEQPVEAQPPTVLVFKDGHQSQILNYAIVGDNLYELNNGRSIRIALAELDLPATQKENDQRGVEFKVPPVKAN